VITWALFALKAWGLMAQKIAGPLMVITWWLQIPKFDLWPGSVLLGFAAWSFWYLSRRPIKALFQTPRA